MVERKQFIRFKNIPDNEISGVYDGDNGRIRDEVGVSCYEFIKRGEYHNIILSSYCAGFLHDLTWFLEDLKCGDIPVFLIEAEQVGVGSYGEPVVKNINVIRELEYVELVEPKPQFKMDKRNPQLK